MCLLIRLALGSNATKVAILVVLTHLKERSTLNNDNLFNPKRLVKENRQSLKTCARFQFNYNS